MRINYNAITKTINEYGETVVTMTLNERGPLTESERQMIREARNRTPVYDEDCPPMPAAMHRQIQRDISNRRLERSQGRTAQSVGVVSG